MGPTTIPNDHENGVFRFRVEDGPAGIQFLGVIASTAKGWEHVSVTGQTQDPEKFFIPSWLQMCYIKDRFWHEFECVMQLHVPKKDWVNVHPACLHLWKPLGKGIPRPPKSLV